ncbi:hypothetical protein [Argonema galeatum]|uniref:hypothetical protein n=1 Tax=Argonema galeatum TaxID=2942762 RepID=UPI0020124E6B|nr:hypothetical protein [Argonema galeatum]MCL1466162.1 hypothetical protein [Argonema galeatum A003/A1]
MGETFFDGVSAALISAAIVVLQPCVAVAQFLDEHEQSIAAIGKDVLLAQIVKP